MRIATILMVLFFSAQTVFGQPSKTEVPSADQVMNAAFAQAKKENKNVILMFHASWCGWCHRMDTSLNDPAIKKFFDDNYVITHLVVDESASNKNLENPGAYELRTKYHGDGVGIPFWLIFNGEGVMLADSKIRKNGENEAGGNNIGCPANAEEVAYFVQLLKKTSKLNEKELALIAERFRKNEH